MMRKLIITLAALLLCGAAYTQVELPYSQIINNPSWVNPAYIGMNKGTTLDLAYKRQWEGFDGAPKTIGFNIHNSFDKIRLGIGIDGHFEEIGHRNANRIGLNLNTMVNITRTSRLMFGLALGLDMRRYKSSATSEASDAGYTSSGVFDDQNNFMGGFGINYKWKELQIGASAQMIFMKEDGVADYVDGTDDATFVNVHAEYNLQLAPDWSLKPMALYRYSNYFEKYGEIGVMGNYGDLIGIGTSYQFDRCVVVFAEVEIGKFLTLAYNYDINTGDLTNLSNGSHEFGLKFSLNGLLKK